MATITRRDGGQWQAKIRRRGYPTQSKTFDTRKDAEIWARDIERDLDRGLYIPRKEAERTTLADVIDRYSVEVLPLKKSQRQGLSCLRGIKAELGDYALATITPALIAKYRDKRLRQVDAQTVRKDLGMIQRVLKTAHMDWGITLPQGIPTQLVRMPAQPQGRDRRVGPEECKAIIKATESPELPTFITLAVETGARRSELIKLTWGHIDLSKRVATLVDTKNGDSRRDVPLSSIAVEAIQAFPRRLSGRFFGLTLDAATRAFSRALKRARARYIADCEQKGEEANPGYLVGIRLHDLRHEATSRFFERGLSIMEVATITGHKDLKMLQRYTHLRAEDLALKLSQPI